MAKRLTLEEKLERKISELDDIKNSDTYKLIRKLEKEGYNYDAIVQILKASKRNNPNSNKPYEISGDHYKFIAFGDSHIGHKQYDGRIMSTIAKVAKDENVDGILCTGDIADGWYQNRPASIFEQDAIGFDNQLEKSVKEFQKLDIGKPIYFITGNHEYNTFVRGAGVEFGEILGLRLDRVGIENYYLGNSEGNLKLETGAKIKMLHPDGGTAYAISYRPQKIIESLQESDGKLPNVALIGHFHKSEYIHYHGVDTFQTGTLCGQSSYMRNKGLQAHKGFWLIDLYSKKNGRTDKIIPQWFPFR